MDIMLYSLQGTGEGQRLTWVVCGRGWGTEWSCTCHVVQWNLQLLDVCILVLASYKLHLLLVQCVPHFHNFVIVIISLPKATDCR